MQCRLCLREDTTLVQDIFNSQLKCSDLTLVETLYWIFDVEVDVSDPFPKFICARCENVIRCIGAYRSLYRRNQLILQGNLGCQEAAIENEQPSTAWTLPGNRNVQYIPSNRHNSTITSNNKTGEVIAHTGKTENVESTENSCISKTGAGDFVLENNSEQDTTQIVKDNMNKCENVGSSSGSATCQLKEEEICPQIVVNTYNTISAISVAKSEEKQSIQHSNLTLEKVSVSTGNIQVLTTDILECNDNASCEKGNKKRKNKKGASKGTVKTDKSDKSLGDIFLVEDTEIEKKINERIEKLINTRKNEAKLAYKNAQAAKDHNVEGGDNKSMRTCTVDPHKPQNACKSLDDLKKHILGDNSITNNVDETEGMQKWKGNLAATLLKIKDIKERLKTRNDQSSDNSTDNSVINEMKDIDSASCVKTSAADEDNEEDYVTNQIKKIYIKKKNKDEKRKKRKSDSDSTKNTERCGSISGVQDTEVSIDPLLKQMECSIVETISELEKVNGVNQSLDDILEEGSKLILHQGSSMKGASKATSDIENLVRDCIPLLEKIQNERDETKGFLEMSDGELDDFLYQSCHNEDVAMESEKIDKPYAENFMEDIAVSQPEQSKRRESKTYPKNVTKSCKVKKKANQNNLVAQERKQLTRKVEQLTNLLSFLRLLARTIPEPLNEDDSPFEQSKSIPYESGQEDLMSDDKFVLNIMEHKKALGDSEVDIPVPSEEIPSTGSQDELKEMVVPEEDDCISESPEMQHRKEEIHSTLQQSDNNTEKSLKMRVALTMQRKKAVLENLEKIKAIREKEKNDKLGDAHTDFTEKSVSQTKKT